MQAIIDRPRDPSPVGARVAFSIPNGNSALQTKLGICLLQVSLIDEALEQLQVLFQDPIETDLCLDAADALYQCDRPAEVQPGFH